jgi:hypothetical protein
VRENQEREEGEEREILGGTKELKRHHQSNYLQKKEKK